MERLLRPTDASTRHQWRPHLSVPVVNPPTATAAPKVASASKRLMRGTAATTNAQWKPRASDDDRLHDLHENGWSLRTCDAIRKSANERSTSSSSASTATTTESLLSTATHKNSTVPARLLRETIATKLGKYQPPTIATSGPSKRAPEPSGPAYDRIPAPRPAPTHHRPANALAPQPHQKCTEETQKHQQQEEEEEERRARLFRVATTVAAMAVTVAATGPRDGFRIGSDWAQQEGGRLDWSPSPSPLTTAPPSPVVKQGHGCVDPWGGFTESGDQGMAPPVEREGSPSGTTVESGATPAPGAQGRARATGPGLGLKQEKDPAEAQAQAEVGVARAYAAQRGYGYVYVDV